MSVAIVIPSYGHFDYVSTAIATAAEHTPDPLLLIIDDASLDWPGERAIIQHIPPDVRFCIQRYEDNGGLTRSWNSGARLAETIGAEYVVFGNSDLLFSPGWWEPLAIALESFSFVGPVTNAPGHVTTQDVKRHLPEYSLSGDALDPDEPEAIADVAKKLRDLCPPAIQRTGLNGFCFATKIETIRSLRPERRDWLFDPGPDFKMVGQEDELFTRAASRGLFCGIVPSSFVFHYRSVSRESHPSLSRGKYRKKSKICNPCLEGEKLRKK